ncbi:hypothetical protein EDF62_2878 [Leucobacter luti]|uniref:Uncharacterized protein n=1 Tax=Leucobacter luti TaxID=340320 RepID=A0A4R6RTQ4_9MICO|nr:hypothetical protein [Leucobacter luti]TDP90309.1 hypothetical protein EDF62_2878 [Leucobacter luti]
MIDDRDRLLHEIRKVSYSEEPFPLIALGTEGPWVATIYREQAAGPRFGRFSDSDTLARQFTGASLVSIADAVTVGDLRDPSGDGIPYQFTREPELIGTRETVRWIDEVFSNSMMETWG